MAPPTKADQEAEVARILKCKPGDHFTILSLDVATAELEDVNRAHKSVVLKVHPDKCVGVAKAADAFTIAQKAYETLKDETAFNRFKKAYERKHVATAAAQALAAGRGVVPVDEALQAERDREERYLAAVRVHREHEAKRNRSEQEKKQTAAARSEIAEQLEQVQKMQGLYGAAMPPPGAAVSATAKRQR